MIAEVLQHRNRPRWWLWKMMDDAQCEYYIKMLDFSHSLQVRQPRILAQLNDPQITVDSKNLIEPTRIPPFQSNRCAVKGLSQAKREIAQISSDIQNREWTMVLRTKSSD